MAEEGTHSSASSANEDSGKGEPEVGENEEFYETIEAPKFVDFTVPDHYRPDDRFWFCSRVGCNQKHEEEMDSEAIYKNFVLRVLAARSPNVKLQKALNRNCSSKTMKCPLSAPPKSSRSRLSRLGRLAVISSVSLKMDDKKERLKPPSKACSSTPMAAKGKEVAAKYLTTPRNKKCPADQNAFRSVRNSKPPSVVVPKSRSVAKALTFSSPKKAFNLKSSVELRTPLTKLCQKMKKLEVTSQRKQLGPPVHSSAISHKLISGQNKCLKGNILGKVNKRISMKKEACPILSGQTLFRQDDTVLSKNPVSVGESEVTDNDDKENAGAMDENRGFSHKNDQSGREILGIHNSDRRKVAEAVEKNRKGQAANGGAPGLKLMKLKTTNPKPFKLRTDERGILREANSERKNNANTPQKEAVLVAKCEGRNLMGQNRDPQKGIVGGLKSTKKEVNTRTPNGQKQHQPIQEELKKPTSVSNARQKLENESKNKAPSGNSKPKETGTLSSSRGRRRAVTAVPREPKSCAGKTSS